ncbi:uncharacterized protein LOC119670997 [Teleopsis dalmanni]|uniref:uncharacterized protein LOC119670997 n=1 Tax=Teleopsis dalmanni TaxID=139649 RepID=UPI0018CD5AD6|nr:uncharacterized protein LOC119670997 [Teleopsis dalmanni]
MILSKVAASALLMTAADYSMFHLSPTEDPYAFSALAVSFCVGLISVLKGVYDDDETSQAQDNDYNTEDFWRFAVNVLEMAQLPLINVHMYLQSQRCHSLARTHGIFIIPLSIEVLLRYFSDLKYDVSFKNLTILGNVFSLLFLAINENNKICFVLASVSSFTYVIASFMGEHFRNSRDIVKLIGHSAFVLTIAFTVKDAAIAFKKA